MKRVYLIFLFALMAATLNAQFLFRISGGGLDNPLFILGTIHNQHSSVLDHSPEYQKGEAPTMFVFGAGLDRPRRNHLIAA